MSGSFKAKVEAYWTPERERRVTGGKNLLLTPTHAPELLRHLGILNADASMSAKSIRKFRQVNHMIARLRTSIDGLIERHESVRVFDVGCGNSCLTFLLTWYIAVLRQRSCRVLGIDRKSDVIARCRESAAALGYAEYLGFVEGDADDQSWSRAWRSTSKSEITDEVPAPHLVVALHACDTATDRALVIGVRTGAEVIAVAPCCQAELGREWAAIQDPTHPFSVLFDRPNLRRDVAAVVTDAMRVVVMETIGYDVMVEDFVPSEETAKNRMIQCLRRANEGTIDRSRLDAFVNAMGGRVIALANELLPRS